MKSVHLNKKGPAKYKTHNTIMPEFVRRTFIPLREVMADMDLRVVNGMVKREEIVFDTERNGYAIK